MLIAALMLAGCSGSDEADSTTTEPASKFGSTMGVDFVGVEDVRALGPGPSDGESWTIPVGVNVCGRFIDPMAGVPTDGVTSNPDGLATVEADPASDGGPTIGDFARSAGIDLSAGRIALSDGATPAAFDDREPPLQVAGSTFASGDACGAETGQVEVWIYSEAARDSGDGIFVVSQDLANIPFAQEGMAAVIAFRPESSLPTLPPSALIQG